MKSFFLSFCLLAIAVSTSFGQTWETLVDIKGRFQIDFPLPPNYKSQDLVSNNKIIQNESYFVIIEDTDHPNTLYLANILQYGKDVLALKEVEDYEVFINNTILAIAESNKAKISYTKIAWDESGRPLVDFRLIITTSKQVVRGKMLISELGDVFIAQVYSSEPNSLNEFIDIYLKSLKLL